MKEKYTLVGVDGNAYSIMGYVCQAMKREGKTKEQINEYLKDAKNSDYSHLVAVSAEMINQLNDEVENDK